MTIKKTAITLLCLGALGGTAYGAIEAPTASAHMHYPMLRLCHKQSFKTITNKHISIKVPKYLVADSSKPITFDTMTQLLSSYKLKGVGAYTITGLGKPQTLHPHGPALNMDQLKKAPKVTLLENGKKVTGYTANVQIKSAFYGFNHLRGTLNIKLFIPIQQTSTVTFNAGAGSFADGVSTATVEALKNETLATESLPVAPTREGYTFVGWSTKDNGNNFDKTDVTQHAITDNVTYYAIWEKTTGNPIHIKSASGGAISMSQTQFSFTDTLYVHVNPNSGQHLEKLNFTPTKADGSVLTENEMRVFGWHPQDSMVQPKIEWITDTEYRVTFPNFDENRFNNLVTSGQIPEHIGLAVTPTFNEQKETYNARMAMQLDYYSIDKPDAKHGDTVTVTIDPSKMPAADASVYPNAGTLSSMTFSATNTDDEAIVYPIVRLNETTLQFTMPAAPVTIGWQLSI